MRASQVVKDDSDGEEADIEDFLVEIEICIKESYANLKVEALNKLGKMAVKKEPFKIISDRIQIVDIPGIEDGQHSVPIKAYIETHKDRIIPVILINLT